MPELTLKFDYRLLTDSKGNPVNSNNQPVNKPDDYEYVLVLTSAQQSGPEPDPATAGKAFSSDQGWRDPENNGALYTVQCNPPQKWDTCMSNDILEPKD